MKHPKCQGCHHVSWCMLTLEAHIELCEVTLGEEETIT